MTRGAAPAPPSRGAEKRSPSAAGGALANRSRPTPAAPTARATQSPLSAALATRTVVLRAPVALGGVQRCPCAGAGTPCPRCEEERRVQHLQRAAAPNASGGPLSVAPHVGRQVDALRGHGAPLPRDTRTFFESRFGHDFSAVRVHDGPDAARSARALQARAYTTGPDVVFGDGQYAPDTTAGRHLLAHELTHVVQQGGASGSARRHPPSASSLTVGPVDDPLEREAEHVATRVTSGGGARDVAPPHAVSVASLGVPDAPHATAGTAQRAVIQRDVDPATFDPTVPLTESPTSTEDLERAVELTEAWLASRSCSDPSMADQVAIAERNLAELIELCAASGCTTPFVEEPNACEGEVPADAPAAYRPDEPLVTAFPGTHVELAEAIEATQRYIDTFRHAGTVTDQDIATAEQNLGELQRQRDAINAEPLESGKRAVWEEGTQSTSLGIVSEDAGAWFYTSRDGVPIRRLPLNTLVAVERTLSGGWYLVVTREGDTGYMTAATVNTTLPDPEATLYRIQSGDTAIGIVKKFYTNFQYGMDQRFYINVLVLVNHQADRKGITNPSLTTDDEGRTDVDWEASQVFAGRQIWIPGQEYAKGLHDRVSSGSISYEAFKTLGAVLSAAGEFLIGSVAFVAGLLHGALESLWDLLVGLVDLVKMVFSLVKSIILGEIIDDIENLWDTIENVKLSDVFDAVSKWLDDGWNGGSTWDRWHFRGWLIGYIIMEIVMLFFSGGALSALKWVGKSATVAKLVAKLPFLAKVVKAAEGAKDAKAFVKLAEALKVGEALAKAQKWAAEVLRIPVDLLKWLTIEAIERLKSLPAWAMERFAELSPAAMKIVLACSSPCKVILADILAHLSGLGAKGSKAAKLTSTSEVLAALPKGLNVDKIAPYLDSHPALMEAIRKAGLTADDFGALPKFLTGADATNLETGYNTFVRYLTYVVPAKTGSDARAFNEVMAAILKADVRQGAALKGPMFEAFARMHLPEFQNKVFKRVYFRSGATLELAKERRAADFFIDATGELWDFKHSVDIDWVQAGDYLKIMNTAQPGLPKVTSVNYLFATREFAENNRKLKGLGAFVYYVDDAGKMVPLP